MLSTSLFQHGEHGGITENTEKKKKKTILRNLTDRIVQTPRAPRELSVVAHPASLSGRTQPLQN